MGTCATTSRYRTSIHYDDVVRGSQNELRACPASDDAPAARGLPGHHPPRRRGCCRTTDYWGTRVDTFGIREPHVSLEIIAEASVETLPAPAGHRVAPASRELERAGVPRRARRVPRPHRAHRVGRRRRGGRRAHRRRHRRRRGGHRAGAPPLRAHLARATRPGATYIGVDVERGAGQGQGRVPGLRPPRGRPVPQRRHPGPLRVGLLLRRAPTQTGAEVDGDEVHVQTHAWFEAAIPGLGLAGPRPHQRPAGRASATSRSATAATTTTCRRCGACTPGGGRPSTDAIVEIRRHARGRPAAPGPAAAASYRAVASGPSWGPRMRPIGSAPQLRPRDRSHGGGPHGRALRRRRHRRRSRRLRHGALRRVGRAQHRHDREGKLGGTCLNVGLHPGQGAARDGGHLPARRPRPRTTASTPASPRSTGRVSLARKDTIVERPRVRASARCSRAARSRCSTATAGSTPASRSPCRGGSSGDLELTGDAVVLAPGSLPRTLPGFDVDGTIVMTSDEVLSMPRAARSAAAIIGGGVIGCEFASMLPTSAPKVTILEALPEDPARARQGRHPGHREVVQEAGHRHPHRRARSRATRPATAAPRVQVGGEGARRRRRRGVGRPPPEHRRPRPRRHRGEGRRPRLHRGRRGLPHRRARRVGRRRRHRHARARPRRLHRGRPRDPGHPRRGPGAASTTARSRGASTAGPRPPSPASPRRRPRRPASTSSPRRAATTTTAGR